MEKTSIDNELKQKARSCYGKDRYESEEIAIKVRAILVKSRKKDGGIPPKREYWCQECCGYHHTKQELNESRNQAS
jgi:hypothetical protein